MRTHAAYLWPPRTSEDSFSPCAAPSNPLCPALDAVSARAGRRAPTDARSCRPRAERRVHFRTPLPAVHVSRGRYVSTVVPASVPFANDALGVATYIILNTPMRTLFPCKNGYHWSVSLSLVLGGLPTHRMYTPYSRLGALTVSASWVVTVRSNSRRISESFVIARRRSAALPTPRPGPMMSVSRLPR